MWCWYKYKFYFLAWLCLINWNVHFYKVCKGCFEWKLVQMFLLKKYIHHHYRHHHHQHNHHRHHHPDDFHNIFSWNVNVSQGECKYYNRRWIGSVSLRNLIAGVNVIHRSYYTIRSEDDISGRWGWGWGWCWRSRHTGFGWLLHT